MASRQHGTGQKDKEKEKETQKVSVPIHAGASQARDQRPEGAGSKRARRFHKRPAKVHSRSAAVQAQQLNDLMQLLGEKDGKQAAKHERSKLDAALAENQKMKAQLDRVQEKIRSPPEPEDLHFHYETDGFDLGRIVSWAIYSIMAFMFYTVVMMLSGTMQFYAYMIDADTMTKYAIRIAMGVISVGVPFVLAKTIVGWISRLLVVTRVHIFPTRIYWDVDAASLEEISTTDDIRPPALSMVDMVYDSPKVVIATRTQVPYWLEFFRGWSFAPMLFEFFVKSNKVRVSWTVYCALRTYVMTDLSASDQEARHNISVALKRMGYVNADVLVLARTNYYHNTLEMLLAKLRSERQESMRVYGSF